MADTPRCETCKHWDSEPYKTFAVPVGDCLEGVELGDPSLPADKRVPPITLPAFGCSLHEPK